jgi:hypothetical protein
MVIKLTLLPNYASEQVSGERRGASALGTKGKEEKIV